ncbi:hypothetical protein [Chroococcidiopsis sp. SAG 2025]|uniref:hypothetical protein n=1 Tax=Chroococcidiopsis sp. SAG 2025 TaxID=171389 RepID=UPI0029371EDD|nr:hypothetical protein [Chroococcidiopsis sp. SAG 2025]
MVAALCNIYIGILLRPSQSDRTLAPSHPPIAILKPTASPKRKVELTTHSPTIAVELYQVLLNLEPRSVNLD